MMPVRRLAAALLPPRGDRARGLRRGDRPRLGRALRRERGHVVAPRREPGGRGRRALHLPHGRRHARPWSSPFSARGAVVALRAQARADRPAPTARPSSSSARFALAQGLLGQAAARFRRAAELDPSLVAARDEGLAAVRDAESERAARRGGGGAQARPQRPAFAKAPDVRGAPRPAAPLAARADGLAELAQRVIERDRDPPRDRGLGPRRPPPTSPTGTRSRARRQGGQGREPRPGAAGEGRRPRRLGDRRGEGPRERGGPPPERAPGAGRRAGRRGRSAEEIAKRDAEVVALLAATYLDLADLRAGGAAVRPRPRPRARGRRPRARQHPRARGPRPDRARPRRPASSPAPRPLRPLLGPTVYGSPTATGWPTRRRTRRRGRYGPAPYRTGLHYGGASFIRGWRWAGWAIPDRLVASPRPSFPVPRIAPRPPVRGRVLAIPIGGAGGRLRAPWTDAQPTCGLSGAATFRASGSFGFGTSPRRRASSPACGSPRTRATASAASVAAWWGQDDRVVLVAEDSARARARGRGGAARRLRDGPGLGVAAGLARAARGRGRRGASSSPTSRGKGHGRALLAALVDALVRARRGGAARARARAQRRQRRASSRRSGFTPLDARPRADGRGGPLTMDAVPIRAARRGDVPSLLLLFRAR